MLLENISKDCVQLSALKIKMQHGAWLLWLLIILTDTIQVSMAQGASEEQDDDKSHDTYLYHVDGDGVVISQNKCVIIHIQRTDIQVHALNCSDKNLHNVPVVQTDKKVQFVDLSYNFITELPVIDKSFSGVVTLNVSHNRIKTIDTFMSLACVDGLLYLDIGYNLLQQIPRQLRSLQVLKLSGNLIEMWNNAKLPSTLKELYLDNNILDDVGMVGCDLDTELKVELLNLTNNRITRLIANTFQCFTRLKRLFISTNSIMKIETGTFDKCVAIELLDLSTNKLRSLPRDLFRQLHNLKYLYLSHNKLVSVPDQIPMLSWLDLSFNRIKTIPEKMSRSLYPQDVFLLGGNPLVCDGDILWLKELYGTREYLLKHLKIDNQKFIPVCAYPPKLANIHWDQLKDDQFTCSNLNDLNTDVIHQNLDSTLIETDSLRASVIGSDFVTLTWAGNRHLEHDSVRISYHEFSKRDQSKSRLLPLTKTSWRIQSVKPNTPYMFCLEYVLERGAVSSQDCIEVITSVPESPIQYMIHLINNNLQLSLCCICFLCACIVLILVCMFKSNKVTKLKTS